MQSASPAIPICLAILPEIRFEKILAMQSHELSTPSPPAVDFIDLVALRGVSHVPDSLFWETNENLDGTTAVRQAGRQSDPYPVRPSQHTQDFTVCFVC